MRKVFIKAIVTGIGSCVGYRLATLVCDKVSNPVVRAKFKRKFIKRKSTI